MKLDELKNITSLPRVRISDEQIEELWALHEDERDEEGLFELKMREHRLAEEIEKASSNASPIKNDLIYVAMGNARCKDDYLRLVARYGPPANRDLDHDVLREYEALCEAVYRVGALLAYGEGFGEFEDVEEIIEVVKKYPSYEEDFTIPASLDIIVRIPDYRRVILPGEIRVEDVNNVYAPPMLNPVRHHKWKEPGGIWHSNGVYGYPEHGMRKYCMAITTEDENRSPYLDTDSLRFFCSAFAREVANEQVRDTQLSFYDGEVDLFDPLGACDPPIWRMVWLALCMARGKSVPSICRTCGKLVDRRSERRSKTLSCTDSMRRCTAAYNNNGKQRMIRRVEWGRPFAPDKCFDYIGDYRKEILAELAEQKANPNWPPCDSQSLLSR